MSDSETLTAEIFLDAQVPVDHERLLVDTFAAFGVIGRVRVVPARRGLDQLNWLVLVALPMHAFLSTVGRTLAEDAYQRLRQALRTLFGGSQSPPGHSRPVVLQDAATGLQVVLEPDLPDDGYRQLLDLDLSEFRLGPVHYDRSQGRWRSELDEATPRSAR